MTDQDKIALIGKELGWHFIPETPYLCDVWVDDDLNWLWLATSGLTHSGTVALQDWLRGKGYSVMLNPSGPPVTIDNGDGSMCAAPSILGAAVWVVQEAK